MTVITRFAPSPTGYLHIGSARTALFNWLFARHHKGLYYLRIEDTDRERSTPEAVDAILQGLKWLHLPWDGDIVFQFERAERHQKIAQTLVDRGHAYYCTCSPEDLDRMRETCKAQGLPPRYDGRCRHLNRSQGTPNSPAVVRFKMPQTGSSTLHDLVQGEVTVHRNQLDDFVLLRADGTPTYMLSVVVDDYDMKITHVIRGDDHLTNTFRQKALYEGMAWPLPEFAHIPLIHGADGAKLSKRHGALGVDAYRDLGYLPQALCNYLCRLGWSHGDHELFTMDEAIDWFSLDHVGRSPARFDFAKLDHINAHYLRQTSTENLIKAMTFFVSYDEATLCRLDKGMEGLKQRAKTLVELVDNARIYGSPITLDTKAEVLLTPDARHLLKEVYVNLEKSQEWTQENLEKILRHVAETKDVKLGSLAQPLRAALTGQGVSPGVFEVMWVLGKEETLARIQNVID